MARILEFQIAFHRYYPALVNRLRWTMVCTRKPFPLLGEAEEFILDHVSFPTTGMLMRDEENVTLLTYNHTTDPEGGHTALVTHQLRAHIPVTLYFKPESSLRDPWYPLDLYWKATTPLGKTLPSVTLVVNLIASGDQLCAQYADITSLIFDIPQSLKDAIANAFPSNICSPLRLDRSLRDFLGLSPVEDSKTGKLISDPGIIKNAAVSANIDLTTLAIRIEFDGPFDEKSYNSFGDFHDGVLQPGLPNRDWSVFIDKDLLLRGVKQRFLRELKRQDEENEEKRLTVDKHDDGEPAVTAEWASTGADPGGGIVTLTFSGEVFVEEGPISCWIGVDPVVIQNTVTFRTPTEHFPHPHIDVLGSIDWTSELSDELSCGLPWDMLVGIVAQPLSTIALTGFSIAAAFAEPSKEDIPLPPSCEQPTNTTFHCRFPCNIPALQMKGVPSYLWAELTPEEMGGHPGGVVLGGSVSVQEQPESLLTVPPAWFDFGMRGNCSDGFKVGYLCVVKIGGLGQLCPTYKKVENVIGTEIEVVDQHIEVINDPLGVFHVKWPSASLFLMGNTFFVEFPGALAEDAGPDGKTVNAYFSKKHHYACELVIRTSVGSRCVRIPPFKRADESAFEIDLLVARAECSVAMVQFSPSALNTHWWTDPPVEVPVRLIPERAPDDEIRVNARLAELQFTSPLVMAGARMAAGMMRVRDAPLKIEGLLVIEAGEFGTLRTRFRQTLRRDLELIARKGEAQVKLSLTSELRITIELPSQELTRGIAQASAELRIDPAHLEWSATLAPLTVRRGRTPRRLDGMARQAPLDGQTKS